VRAKKRGADWRGRVKKKSRSSLKRKGKKKMWRVTYTRPKGRGKTKGGKNRSTKKQGEREKTVYRAEKDSEEDGIKHAKGTKVWNGGFAWRDKGQARALNVSRIEITGTAQQQHINHKQVMGKTKKGEISDSGGKRSQASGKRALKPERTGPQSTTMSTALRLYLASKKRKGAGKKNIGGKGGGCGGRHLS